MSTSEERMRILKMIAEKQITAEEGSKLLEALRVSDSEARDRSDPTKSRWLRVRVTDRSTGKTKVNVNIPVGLVDVGLKMGARFAPEMAGMDLQAIQAAVREGYQGRIVEVDDEEDNERVEIFIE
jgi:SHOCT-like domain